MHDYDIVYGPIADDKVMRQAARYLKNYITLDEFLEGIKFLRGITFQYLFATERAVRLLNTP
ncbi:MAG: DUF3990 domain-containing protein [Bacteroidales bacterium]|nr:DUF3990 domain-containing protein [Bacteroidales bacterium]